MDSTQIQQLTQDAIANINSIEEALNAARTAIAERDSAIASLNQAVTERDSAVQTLNDLVNNLNLQIQTLQSSLANCTYANVQDQIAAVHASYQAQFQSYQSEISSLNEQLTQARGELTAEEMRDAEEAAIAYNNARNELQSQVDSALLLANSAADAISEATRVRDEAVAALQAIVDEAAASRAAVGV